MKTLWHDPVWSNVIAGANLAVLAVVGTYSLRLWPIMTGFLSVKIPLIVFIPVLIAAGLASYLLAMLRAPRRSLDIAKSDK